MSWWWRVSTSWFWWEGGVNGCVCFLSPVASGATQVWPRHYPLRRPQWTDPSGVWMTPACRCPLIWLTSSTEWSRFSGGGPKMLNCRNLLMYTYASHVAYLRSYMVDLLIHYSTMIWCHLMNFIHAVMNMEVIQTTNMTWQLVQKVGLLLDCACHEWPSDKQLSINIRASLSTYKISLC